MESDTFAIVDININDKEPISTHRDNEVNNQNKQKTLVPTVIKIREFKIQFSSLISLI